MQCPKCSFESDDNAIECHRCGIVFAKYARRRETQKQATAESVAERKDIRQELKYRILAVPLALVIARLAVATVPFLTRMLSMMVHESGHAVSAWICGYAATPGIWFTPISDERSIWVPVFLVAGMGCLS